MMDLPVDCSCQDLSSHWYLRSRFSTFGDDDLRESCLTQVCKDTRPEEGQEPTLLGLQTTCVSHQLHLPKLVLKSVSITVYGSWPARRGGLRGDDDGAG